MTSDLAAAAERLITAYNAKDFESLRDMIVPDLDFAHFNRPFAFKNRDELLGVLRHFATEMAPDRMFLAPERVITSGPVVIREAWYTGTAKIDLPGFAAAGNSFRLKFCSVMRFDARGLLVEWKDYG